MGLYSEVHRLAYFRKHPRAVIGRSRRIHTHVSWLRRKRIVTLSPTTMIEASDTPIQAPRGSSCARPSRRERGPGQGRKSSRLGGVRGGVGRNRLHALAPLG